VTCSFAIIPDGSGGKPVAVFENLEDAMEWGVTKFGGGKFSIRHIPVTEALTAAPELKLAAN
jgi:hypothetical protein